MKTTPRLTSLRAGVIGKLREGRSSMSSPVVWRRAFADIPSTNFVHNYDRTHFVLQGMDSVSPLPEFGDRPFHVRPKDARIRHERRGRP